MKTEYEKCMDGEPFIGSLGTMSQSLDDMPVKAL